MLTGVRVTRHTHSAARASPSWLLGATRDRLRAQWPLMLAVIAVAVLANTLVTSLGLLVTATEAQGARGSLSALPDSQTAINVRLVDLVVPVDEAHDAVTAAVQKALGPSVGLTSDAVALTEVGEFPNELPVEGAAYFGQLNDIHEHATLTSGIWADEALTSTGAVAVTLPKSAATALDLGIGSTLDVELSDTVYTAEVVGIYVANTDDEDYWRLDPLRGDGFDPAYPKPGITFFTPISAVGPLIVTPGAFTEALVPVATLQLSYDPDFSGVGVDELAPLIQRLGTADVDVRVDAGRLSSLLQYTSDVGSTVVSVTSGLVVTRSTVVIVSLLLLVLAVAAMAQAARLVTDSRATERRLMRSRGAARGHLLALAVVEALIIGAITAVLSPVLAAQAYRLIAAQPAMRAADMPAQVQVSPLAWATSAGVALAFVIVLVGPLLVQPRAAVDEEQASARPNRVTGFMRSGVDLALIVLAALAYWQLASYRGVLDTSVSLSIDPVLAVGPALVLLAGALLCVRLIPLASRLVERAGSRSNRVVLPLASWELGRRPTRAVAAVLLLSLALAVGTFGLSFLQTWRQSQLDQATVAVGAPVRVAASGDVFDQQLEVGGDAAAVFRRFGLLQLGARESGGGSDGVSVQVLGLDEAARALLDSGRVGEVGGAHIDRVVRPPVDESAGMDIASGSEKLSTTVQLSDETGALEGAAGMLRAIVEDQSELITTIDFGPVPVDGAVHELSADLPQVPGLRLVGIQVVFDGEFRAGDAVTLQLGQFAVDGDQLDDTVAASWHPVNGDKLGRVPTLRTPSGSPLQLTMDVPADLASAFTLVGWQPQPAIIAVAPKQLADRYQLEPGALLSMTTQAAVVSLQLSSFAPLIPGAAAADEIEAAGYGLSSGAARASTIVVDQRALARALAQAGVASTMVDEWWLDVADGQGQAYVDAHPVDEGAVPVYSSEVLGTQLQQAPLRVATQAALWVSIAAGALLAAVGFALHSAAALRARRIELAQLRAIGLTRRGLIALVGVESLLLCVLGIVFGVSTGLLLATLIGPLVAVSPDGSEPVPSVLIEIPALSIGVLALVMVAALALVVLLVARAQRHTQPADLLRGGAQP